LSQYAHSRLTLHYITPHQGHVEAADLIGSIYFWGQGVAVDYARAIAAYKVAAEGGYVVSQYQVGMVYYRGCSVDVDYEQAIPWFEKAAAQDMPEALTALGGIYYNGQGMPPSFRHAREYWKRAIELGNSLAVENMRVLTKAIPKVTSRVAKQTTLPCHGPCVVSLTVLSSPRTHSTHPSWTSG